MPNENIPKIYHTYTLTNLHGRSFETIGEIDNETGEVTMMVKHGLEFGKAFLKTLQNDKYLSVVYNAHGGACAIKVMKTHPQYQEVLKNSIETWHSKIDRWQFEIGEAQKTLVRNEKAVQGTLNKIEQMQKALLS